MQYLISLRTRMCRELGEISGFKKVRPCVIALLAWEAGKLGSRRRAFTRDKKGFALSIGEKGVAQEFTRLR